MRELRIGWLTRDVTQQLKEGAYAFPDNSYIWIQYRDGSIGLIDMSWDGIMPSFNISKILYITTWWQSQVGGYAELWLNPRLTKRQIEEIITDALYDEDGSGFYNKIEFDRDFDFMEYALDLY